MDDLLLLFFQAALALFGMIGGPQLGLYMLGILYPCTNTKVIQQIIFKTLNKALYLAKLKYKSDCKIVAKYTNCLFIVQFPVLVAPYYVLAAPDSVLGDPDCVPVVLDSVQVMLIAFQ